ncbi:MAG: extracellular solute-binding protein [Clostridiales bacterium]|nr:extracellular solute-binding protein [Clostridiales bacterium]
MKIKRFLAIALCAIMFVMPMFTVACSGGGDDDPLGKVVDDLEFNEYGEPIFNNVKLKVWSIIGNPDDTYFAQVNTMFNDYYRSNGVTATVSPIANADFYTQLANTLNTDPDNAPDVVIFHSERLPMLAAADILLPMDSFYAALGDNNTFSKNNYVQTVMDECIYNGKLYGVPLDMHAGVWYCRQDILEKNGLSVPHTLSEFVEVNNALIDLYKRGELWYRGLEKTTWTKTKDFGADYTPIVMSSLGGIEIGWIPQTAVLQNGGKLTKSNGYPDWNTQGLEDVMSMLRDWQNGTGDFKGTPYKGKFVDPQSDYNTVWSNLASGKSVFSFEGTWWAESRLNEYEETLGNKTAGDANGNTYQPLTIISPSKMFALDETKPYASNVYGVGHCVSICRSVTSKTKCVAAALYAQFVTENSEEYTRGGHLPANVKVLNSDKLKSMSHYNRYLTKMGNPDDFVMLGGTKYYGAVYEMLKNVYVDVFAPSTKSVTVKQIIAANYAEALDMIDAEEGL